MNVLASAMKALSPGPADDYWYTPRISGPTASGQNVDENTALNYSAVWCATRILSEGVAGLPCMLYERLAGGGKSRASGELLYGILHDEPNDETDAFQFFDQMQAWLVNWGNARAEIQRNASGRPVALWPIHPSRVHAKRMRTGEIVYLIRNDNGTDTPIQAADMLDVVGPMSEDGICGKGTIRMARESIGMGLATERYGASFFGKGATPSGVITHPGRLKEEARKNMRRSWKELYGNASGGNEVAILEEGVKFEKVSIPPEDAQFLQSRQHNVTEIARWYRIPPHMLADLSRATFSNIEQQGIDFVVHSLRPWLCRWEKALARKLLLPAEKKTFFVEFLVDALMRGDATARSSALQIQFMNGALSQDEWREIENRNPLPDGLGQKFYRPQNLAEVEPDDPEDATDNSMTEGTATPTSPADSLQASSANVQATALNGAQIASMVQVAQMTVEETFNQDAARGMLAAAFPLLSPEQLNAIVDNLEPKPKEEPASADNPADAGQGSGDNPATDTQPQGASQGESGSQGPPQGLAGTIDGKTADNVKADWIADTARRMRRIERNEMLRAAKHPERFISRLEAFYAKHAETVAEALSPVLGVDADEIAHEYCETSRIALIGASDCQPNELAAAIEKCFNELGGPGSGPQGGESHPHAGHGGAKGPPQKPLSDRAARAKASHNPSTKEKQDLSEAFEHQATAALGGTKSGDNKPMDVTMKVGGKTVGLELKMMHDAKDQRVNMRKDSRQRKEEWASQKGNSAWVVLHDARNTFQGGAHKDKYSGHPFYVKQGVGAFTLASMTKVGSLKEAKAHIIAVESGKK